MVIKIVICLIIVCVIAGVAQIIEDIKKKERNKMSFMESYNLTELTIVTLFNGNVKLNFLLDTGSNNSFLSKSASKIKGLTYKSVRSDKCSIMCASGTSDVEQVVKMNLSYKDNVYTTELHIMESLDTSFNMLKQEYGVAVHGILGTKFMNENNFVLDFEELVAYKK